MHGYEEEINGKTDTVRPLPAKVDTFIVVYIETTNRLISWDTAWQKGQAYLIVAIPIEQTPFLAGLIKGGSKVAITTAKGNFLWQLQLSPIRSLKNLPGKITKDEITLKGRYKGKKFTRKTARLVEIVPLPPA